MSLNNNFVFLKKNNPKNPFSTNNVISLIRMFILICFVRLHFEEGKYSFMLRFFPQKK